MKEYEIQALATSLMGEIEETHISWVILTPAYAFKIKKPLKLSFLDFSTLELRKENCEREIDLNSRYTNIYLSVVTICRHNGRWTIGEEQGILVDYAVRMKRMDGTKRMDKLLEQRQVSEENMCSLAEMICSFHRKTEKIYILFDKEQACNIFNDIHEIKPFVKEQFGTRHVEIIGRSILWSDWFLDVHASRMQQRIDRGFKRDVHGDLHSGNIFLDEKPVLFDCIEFNDQYRQIDLLYEIAFLCMDLEAFDQHRLAEAFLSAYSAKLPCFEEGEDEYIFIYYKCLRANVRAKVHAMSAMQGGDQKERKHHTEETQKYLELMEGYMELIPIPSRTK